MRNKLTLLLISLVLPIMALKAQVVDDTIRTLIVTEFRFLGTASHNYAELTNVGTEPINLSEFKIATLKHGGEWGDPRYGFGANDVYWAWLPDEVLDPGESYLVAVVLDHAELTSRDDKGYPSFQYGSTWSEIWNKVDFKVHAIETVPGDQSVAQGTFGIQYDEFGPDTISAHRNVLNNWQNVENFSFLIEHHVGDDSTVVDAVKLQDLHGTKGRMAVAGVPMAAYKYHLLVRKTTIKEGNIDWEEQRGASLEDSDWIPIHVRRNWRDPNQKYFTTLKVHHDVTLDESSIVPAEGSSASIDWSAGKITLPWGIYADYIMNEFELGENLAWNYKLKDGAVKNMYNTVVEGDTLVMYALGDELEQKAFSIEVTDPPADLAQVFPLNKKVEPQIRSLRYWREEIDRFEDVNEPIPGTEWQAPYYVTLEDPEIDTIGNIPYATRTDTLLKYLEMAPTATREFIWVDDTERVDLKFGDILRITAEDGTTRDYFLKVSQEFEKSHNAYLDAITWPDAPSFLRQSPQWKEDTIPGFNRQQFNYRIELPYGTSSVPGLVPHTEDLNAQVSVKRATKVRGNVEDRTTVFTIAAEDDTTILEYKIEFLVEVRPEDEQPFSAEPIFTQFTKRMAWGVNMMEITNPGNQPLDLSDYMVVIRRGRNQTLAEMISAKSTEDNHPASGKYLRYVPGYLFYVDSLYDAGMWGYLQKDLKTNPILKGGESFTIGRTPSGSAEEKLIAASHMNIVINVNDRFPEELPDRREIVTNSGDLLTFFWLRHHAWALLKITNDSIKAGTKRVGDPSDYELVDLFGTYAGEVDWHATGDTTGRHGWMVTRKTEFWQGDTLPGYQGSWGPTPEESEWIMTEEGNVFHPGFGTHTFDEITVYRSTVNSYTYNVSDGYENYQSIIGVVNGTTVQEFMDNLLKVDEGQTLLVKHRELSDAVVDKDTLVVTSADGQNATEYVLTVGQGLNDDATLTAKTGSGYEILIDGETGSVTGIHFGARLEEVLGNVTKPHGATLNIIDYKGMVVPLQIRNNEGLYVKTQATKDIYFEVVSENNENTILYQLVINVNDNAAMAVSDIYEVDQDIKLISLIPTGTNVNKFLENIHVNEGATFKVIDKIGLERTDGNISFDDRLVVTSPDGSVTKEYFLLFLEESIGGEAWVVSDIFAVDQIERAISNINPNTSKVVFEGLIDIAPRATFVLKDADGNPVDAGTAMIESGYQLVVTSGDKQLEVTYILYVNTTSVDYDNALSDIKAYPNPASDRIIVEGVEESSQIVIMDIVGSIIKIIPNTNYYRTSISITDLPSGVYILYTTTDKARSNVVRFVKE